MPCSWNVPAKIVCTIAGLLALGGIITAIMGYVTGNNAVAPDFEAEEVKQWSVSIGSEAQCAWQIYFKEGEDCQAAVDGLTVSGPATWSQSKYTKHCDSNYLLGFDHIEMDGFNLKWFAQVDPNTQATFRKHNTTSYTLTVLSGDSCDFGVYVRSSRSCSAAFSNLTVSGPTDWGNGFESKCADSFHSQPENYEQVDGEAWRKIASLSAKTSSSAVADGSYTITSAGFEKFSVKYDCDFLLAANVVPGTYSVASSGPDFWVRDVCKEIGEAVGGIFAAMGIMVLAIVLFILSSIFCCVACCCGGCCSSK